RLVDPSEIGKAAVFFASDLSSAVTGQILTVDCGVSLAPYFYNELEDET
ncbi:MAG: SDR family oxidoreductase, partial [Erysipelotrichaceae bacterium]|nr:SDR family oxidoreductase [Erysipelotrichaceae bacterium]